MVFTGRSEELQVRIEGDASDLQASLASVRAGLEVAEQGLDDLADEADDAEDELDDLSRSAAGAAGSVTALGGASVGATSGLSGLRSTLSNVAIVAGGLASTTLPAVAAGLTAIGTAAAGLATGTAGVLGLGAAARGAEQLKTDLQVVRENIRAIARTAGQQLGLGQLLGEGIRSLDDIVARTVARISDELPAFADALRDIGSTLAGVIPGAVEALVRLGRQALPAVRDAVSFLATEGRSIFTDIVAAARELAPEFRRFLDAVIEAAPAILQASTTITDRLLPVLTRAVRLAEGLARAFNGVQRAIGLVGDAIGAIPQFIRSGETPQAFRELGRFLGAQFANGLIQTINETVLGPLEERIARRVQGLSRDDLNLGLSTIPTPSIGGATSQAQAGIPRGAGPRADPGLQALLDGMNEVAQNTDETASNADSTAANTSAVNRTLQNSPLVGGADSRCDLRNALLGPLERAPRPRGGAARDPRTTTAGRSVRGEGTLTAGSAVSPGDGTTSGLSVELNVGAQKLAETTGRAREGLIDSFKVTE